MQEKVKYKIKRRKDSLTDEERRLAVKLYQEGLSYNQITKHVKPGKDAVKNYLKSLGLIRISNKEKGKNQTEKTCRHCKKKFKTYNKKALYCSRKCKNQSNVIWTKEKIITEIRFISDNGTASSIGRETLCTVARRMFGSWEEACRVAEVKPRTHINETCNWCGNAIEEKADRLINYCSEECSDAANKQRWVDNRNKRRLVIDVSSESIKPEDVFIRDKWICQICRRKINPQLKHPHPRSKSIDHIVPLSLGGTHERKNVQAAHLGCNARKGNREVGEQLLIFG